MKTPLPETDATYISRKNVADAEILGCVRVLEMVGINRIGMDVPSTFGDIRALREIMVRSGLTTIEEYSAIAAENTLAFLREVLEKVQQQKQEGEG